MLIQGEAVVDKQSAFKVSIPSVKKVSIRDGHIRLDSLLKYTSVVSTGGEAKMLISDEAVFLNGEVCTMRGKKVYPGDIVRFEDNVFLIAEQTHDDC